jgi:hypothetical protein
MALMYKDGRSCTYRECRISIIEHVAARHLHSRIRNYKKEFANTLALDPCKYYKIYLHLNMTLTWQTN